jgi:hypothetical protein
MQTRTFIMLSVLALPVLAAAPAMEPARIRTAVNGVEEIWPRSASSSGRCRVEEYRMNGVLYMVKVTPTVGPPYYLIDTTGDGNLNAPQRARSGCGTQLDDLRW